jgi:SAM-dependent methyltransferase
LSAERQADEPGSPWWGEHVARYEFATTIVERGTPALDIACGTGFGLRVLRECGARVVGADIDASALRRAAQTVAGTRVPILRADGCRLPFATGAFGLVTSFETIEHLQERARFVAELRRVLAPEGTCLISTPNAQYSRPVDGKPRNPFHQHEYEPGEFEAELRQSFGRVQVVGQVLDGRFRVPPFWDDQQRLPRTVSTLAGLWTRRLMHRLPPSLRDRASRFVWGHDFFPAPADYHFDVVRLKEAQVLLGICGSA